MGAYDDFDGYLAERMRAARAERDGLLSQREGLMSEYNGLDNLSGNDTAGALGASIIPLLTGLFSGDSMQERLGLGLSAAGAAGKEYYAGLDLENERRRKNILDERNVLLGQAGAQDKLLNELTGTGTQYHSAMGQNLELGRIPGSDPYDMVINSEIGKSNAINDHSSANQIHEQEILGNVPGTEAYDLAQQGKVDIAGATAAARYGARPGNSNDPIFKKNLAMDYLASGGTQAGADAIEGAATDNLALQAMKSAQFGVGEERRAKDLDARITGKNQKTLPPVAYDKATSAQNVDAAMQPIIDKIKTVSADLPEGAAGKYTIFELESRIPATEFRDLKETLDFYAGKFATTIYGKAASDREGNIIQNYLAGSSALSMDELIPRIERMKTEIKRDAKGYLKNLRSTEAYKSAADNLMQNSGLYDPITDAIEGGGGVPQVGGTYSEIPGTVRKVTRIK